MKEKLKNLHITKDAKEPVLQPGLALFPHHPVAFPHRTRLTRVLRPEITEKALVLCCGWGTRVTSSRDTLPMIGSGVHNTDPRGEESRINLSIAFLLIRACDMGWINYTGGTSSCFVLNHVLFICLVCRAPFHLRCASPVHHMASAVGRTVRDDREVYEYDGASYLTYYAG
jgi:hypothetical protein